MREKLYKLFLFGSALIGGLFAFIEGILNVSGFSSPDSGFFKLLDDAVLNGQALIMISICGFMIGGFGLWDTLRKRDQAKGAGAK
jgi:hypothetical protein